MSDLIKALQILQKYEDASYPTHCEHDVLQIAAPTPDKVSEEDRKALDELSFTIRDEDGEVFFVSYHFGRA